MENGFKIEDFSLLCGLTSWGTCGDGRPREKKVPEKEEKPVENPHIDRYLTWINLKYRLKQWTQIEKNSIRGKNKTFFSKVASRNMSCFNNKAIIVGPEYSREGNKLMKKSPNMLMVHT